MFGITFQQGRNVFKINEDLLANIVTENRDLPEDARRDMIVALITLKYTQSNSVCYVKDGQAIGVGRASRAASTAPAWRAPRPTPGGCGTTPRCWDCSSWSTSAARTVTTPSMCTSPMSTRTCWRRASGSRPSP